MNVLSKEGVKQKNISLNDLVFNREISEPAIYHAIRNELANLRQGTASTKTRSEVRGSRRKLWKQKGTGRARMGTRQSPVWVGGGIAFGPKPRDYSYKMPRKLKRLAFKSVLSLKAQNDNLVVIEDFAVEGGKTKNLAIVLANLVKKERAVLVVKDGDRLIKRAGRNIPWLTVLSFDKLRVHDLFYGKKVLILESAAVKLNSFYADSTVSRPTEVATSKPAKATTAKPTKTATSKPAKATTSKPTMSAASQPAKSATPASAEDVAPKSTKGEDI